MIVIYCKIKFICQLPDIGFSLFIHIDLLISKLFQYICPTYFYCRKDENRRNTVHKKNYATAPTRLLHRFMKPMPTDFTALFLNN